MFASLISFFLLASPSVDVLRQYHLETPEGQTAFLMDELTPYVQKAHQLNQEITALSEQISKYAEEDNTDFYSLSEQLAEKMAVLSKMLPILNMALHVSADFEHLDAILNTEPLTDEQREIADRIATLCKAIDSE